MSDELREKLDKLSIWIEANRDVSPATWEDEVWPLVREKFTQAFVEDGWVHNPRITIKDYTFILDNDGDQLRTVTTDKHTFMTGEEWFDRFERELDAVMTKIYRADDRRLQDAFIRGISYCLNAARRAAGLEENK